MIVSPHFWEWLTLLEDKKQFALVPLARRDTSASIKEKELFGLCHFRSRP